MKGVPLWIDRHAGPVIFAVSAVMRLTLLFVAGAYKPAPPLEMFHVAKSIAAGQGFANPFGCVTGLTAHLAPVFPYLLSIAFRLFPSERSADLAIRLFKIALVSLTWALMPWLATRLRMGRLIGVYAGLFGAALPLLFWMEVREEWEAPLSALVVVVGLGTFASLFDNPGVRQTVAAGFAWGFALLTAPTLLFTFGLLVLVWWWRLPPSHRGEMGADTRAAAACRSRDDAMDNTQLPGFSPFHFRPAGSWPGTVPVIQPAGVADISGQLQERWLFQSSLHKSRGLHEDSPPR